MENFVLWVIISRFYKNALVERSKIFYKTISYSVLPIKWPLGTIIICWTFMTFDICCAKPPDFYSNFSSSKTVRMHFYDVIKESFPCRIHIISQIRIRSNTQWTSRMAWWVITWFAIFTWALNWWKNRPMLLLHNENNPYWQN